MDGQVLTVAQVFRPKLQKSALLYDTALILAGTVLIALSARLTLWANGPIPITGQTFAVLMLSALYGAKRASLCMLVYIIEGVEGLPVFFGGGAGIAWLLGPTGGYLIGFVIAAYIVGYLSQHGWDRKPATTILAMLLGNICIWLCGISWFAFLISAGRVNDSFSDLLNATLLPYIPGDIIKTLLATAMLPCGWKLLKRFGYDGRSGS